MDGRFPAVAQRWLAGWLLCCLGSLPASGELFEFCDDFRKSWDEQRDPFEERIETERHDFTQSAVTVGRGIIQVESGYSYFYKEKEAELENSHTTPEMLLRIGLSEDIEFRIRWNYAWIDVQEEPNRFGSEDLRYSLKFQLHRQEEAEWRPTTALEVRGSAPTGGEPFTTGRVEFSLDYIYLWQLTERMTLAGSTGFGTDGFGDFGLVPDAAVDDRFSGISQSAVLGLELSESNTAYLEWFGIYSTGLEDEFAISVLNVGIDHYVTDDFVLDLRVGAGLSRDADDFFTGVGGGYRF